MPDPNIPNTVVAGEPITAAPIEANFDYIESWLTANAIQADGSKAFSALPVAPSDVLPSSDGQLITKKVLDDRAALIFFTEHTNARTGIANDTTFKALDVVSDNFTMPIIPAGRLFVVEVVIPIIKVASSGGWPAAAGLPLDLALFMGPNFGAMDRVQVTRTHTGAAPSLFPDGAASVTIKRTFRNNTQFASGTTQKVEVRGRVPVPPGQFTVTGNTEYPIQMTGKMS